RAAVHRGGLALGDLLAVGGVEARAQVLRLSDDLEERGAEDDLPHLLGDRAERAAEHAQRHGVECGLRIAHRASTIRFPCGSTRALMPGLTTVVESNCSITAAPSTTSPARRAARS